MLLYWEAEPKLIQLCDLHTKQEPGCELGTILGKRVELFVF